MQEEKQNLDEKIGKRKRKKKRKKRLPRAPRPRPRLVSGCCLRSTRARPRLLRSAWFYSGYKFLPRFLDKFHTISSWRDARAVRTWKPGLSTHTRYLACTCLVSLEPEENRKFWSFLGDDYAVFHDPVYLTVTCSEFARGVQDYGFFWELTSGWIPYLALLGWTVDTFTSSYGGFMVQTAENCGVSVVAVYDGRRFFLSRCRGRFPWSCCSVDHGNSPVAVLGHGDRWPCCACRTVSPRSFTCALCATTDACGSDCFKTLESPQLQSIKGVDFLFVVHSSISKVLVTMETPQLCVDIMVDSLCCRSCSSLS